MSGGVRFIFKTLIRVPIIIMAFYLVFNLFAFSLTYFKLLGFSYVVMQTAVENNYLPQQEMDSLNKYLADLTDTGVVDNATLITVGSKPGESLQDANGNTSGAKRQYGSKVTIGVQAHYRWVWPLTVKETTVGETGVEGMNGNSFNGFKSDAELEQARKSYEENPDNNIIIKYTVPGLKYYPDLN